MGGLAEYGHSAAGQCTVVHRTVIAASKQNANRGIGAADRANEFHTIHAGHVVIADEAIASLSDGGQSGRAADAQSYFVPRLLENGPQQQVVTRIVVNYDHFEPRSYHRHTMVVPDSNPHLRIVVLLR